MFGIKKITDQKHLILDTIISLAIIFAIFHFIGIENMLREFGSINYFYLLLSAVFLLIMYVGMTERLRIILYELGVKTKFWEIFKMHMVGMLLADFTPARTGYLAVAYGLSKKYKIPEEKSAIAVLGPQVYDFALKVIVGTAGMFYLLKAYLKIDGGEVLFLGALVMGGMILIMLLLLFSKRFLRFFAFTKKIPPADKILSIFEKAQKNSHVILHCFPVLFALLLFNWTAKAISWFFIAKALGITLNTGFPEVFAYFFLQPLLTMLEFIPSPTLAGLGLSEGAGVLVFSVFGIGAAKAASFVFLARVKTILVNLPAVKEALSVLKPD